MIQLQAMADSCEKRHFEEQGDEESRSNKIPRIALDCKDETDSDSDDVISHTKSVICESAVCSICLDEFVDPRGLPCLHTFCFHCLNDVLSKYQPGEMVPCPNCRYTFQMPTNGVDDIPRNFLIRNLMDAERRNEYCREHKSKLAEMYCFTCKAGICHYCFTKEHAHHNCRRYKQALRQLSKQTDNALETLSRCSRDISDEVNASDKCCVDFKARIAKTCESLHLQGEVLKRLVDDQVRVYERNLLSLKADILEKSQASVDKLYHHLDDVDSLRNQALTLKGKTKCSELSYSLDRIHSQMHDLLARSPVSSVHIFPTVTFIPRCLQSSSTFPVGTLSITSNSTADSCGPLEVQLTECIETDTHVRGIAHLDHSVYVVCNYSNTIDVYAKDSRNCASYSRLPGIFLGNKTEVTDIIAYEDGRCLFVSDTAHGRIWRVTPGNKNKEIWLSEDDNNLHPLKPWTLSIFADRLLVVLCSQGLLVVSASAKNASRVNLPEYVDPFHAMETSRGTFIVCYTNKNNDSGTVGEFDGKGQAIASYTVGSGNDVSAMWPFYMACVADGRIAVVDYETNEIVLLDSELRLERVLVRKARDKGDVVRRLCSIVESGLMLVGHSNHISFYRLHRLA